MKECWLIPGRVCRENIELQKKVGELSGRQIIAVIDTREQTPLPIQIKTVRMRLRAGDYSFLGGEELFAVERKNIDDLVACCTVGRERFEWELHRLRGFFYSRLLIVGTEEDIRAHKYVSRAKPESILGSLQAWEVRYRVPIVWAKTPEQGARLVEKWIYFSVREISQMINHMATSYRKIDEQEAE